MDLEPELDRLYGAELGEFVAARTAVVRALRKEGRRAEAAQVQELRKPSLPAWTVNQLVRRNRKDVDGLLAAGERLAAAQQAMLGGGERGAFAEAREREQAALKPLREATRQILGQRASEETLERVTSTLRAAIVTAEGRAQLAEGRLTTEIEPPGFEAFAGSPVAARTSARRASRPAKAKRAADSADDARRKAKAQARATLKGATEREAALAAELRQADKALREAREAVAEAEREAKRLQAEREAATKAVELSRRELDAATEA